MEELDLIGRVLRSKWEYQLITIMINEIPDPVFSAICLELNKHGREGWELCTWINVDGKLTCCLKRRVS